MQIMIDTNTDSPSDLYALGAFLASRYATTAAPSINADKDPGPIVVLNDERDACAFLGESTTVANIAAAITTEDQLERALDARTVPAIPTPPKLTVVPTGTIPAPPGPPAAPDLDSAGVAWDRNLHASTKAKTIDGQWKARRNRSGAVSAGPSLPAGPKPLAFPVDSVPAIPPPPPPVMLPAADDDTEIEIEGEPSTGAPVGIDFPTFITKVTAAMSDGSLSQARLNEVMQAHGLETIFAANTRPDVLGPLAKEFGFT